MPKTYDLIVPHTHRVDAEGKLTDEGILRIRKAAELFLENRGKLLFSGVGCIHDQLVNPTGKSLSSYYKDYALKFSPKITDKDFIVLPYAQSTVGEVCYALKYMLEKDLNSAIFVSSDYHMNRVRTLVYEVYPPLIEVGFEGVKIPLHKNELQKQMAGESEKLLRDIVLVRQCASRIYDLKPNEF